MEFLVDGLNLTKTTKKKLDKLNKINIHLHGKNHSDCLSTVRTGWCTTCARHLLWMGGLGWRSG
jgi:hypothetical protein